MQFRYQRRIYTLLSCFINNHHGHQAKVTHKVKKSVYNIEMYFKQFFICLERTSAFTTSIFRTIYRSSSPDLQICSIFTEEYSWRNFFAWMFSCKLSKWFVEQLSWKKALGGCFCIYESECSICLPAFTCSERK